MKKIKYFLLALTILITTVLGTSCQNGLYESEIPDYSAYAHEFDFYGYSALHDGKYYVDDVEYSVGENFLTVEQYQMYKDVGMTIAFPQGILKIRGEEGAAFGVESDREKFYADRAQDWERAKVEIDKLVSIGIEKTILYDEDLSWLALNDYKDYDLIGLIGEGQKFKTEAELDEYVYKLIQPYLGYKGVYGVTLADEPKYIAVKSYGQVYNAIHRVAKAHGHDLYVDYNLNPLNLTALVNREYYPVIEGLDEIPEGGYVNFEDGFVRYKKYITDFLDELQPKAIQYDDYPIRRGYLSATYIPCLEYIAGVARDRNIEFHMVTQSFGMDSNGAPSMRKLDENGAKWLNNMLLGFGVSEISYFTYFARTESRSDGESFIRYQDYSFVDYYGNKTRMYDIMKDVIASDKKFAPTVLQFDYVKSGVFTHLPMNTDTGHLQNVVQNVQTYSKVKSVSVNKECAMINELYDDENDRYMYMAMNIVDPDFKGSIAYQTITLEFDKEYKYALVFKDGERSLHRLDGNKISVKGAAGDASFIIPF